MLIQVRSQQVALFIQVRFRCLLRGLRFIDGGTVFNTLVSGLSTLSLFATDTNGVAAMRVTESAAGDCSELGSCDWSRPFTV